MTFPETLLPIKVELELDGTWTDITSYVYQRDLIRIIRGRRDEASEVSPTRCTLTLNNNDGRFSPRNPAGAYHGQIGQNTPIRVSVDIGDAYLYTDGGAFATRGFSAPDEASIDITGDLEVQYDGTLDNWHQDGTVELCGKGVQTGDQRSWFLAARDRHLFFEWSADGTSTTLQRTSTEPLPVPASRRLAVKATLDVDNGSSGHTVTFYWADSIDGTWRPLGAPVVTAGTTSVFSSTADLIVGQGWSTLGFDSPLGQTHAMKLLNGIGGTEVANPDFTVQTPGDNEFTDDAGLVWTQGDSVSVISNTKTRFTGEVSRWPVSWETGGFDVYTQIEAHGMRRRLGQGVGALQSTLRRRIPTDDDLIAYWPLEDGINTTRPASPIDGVPAMFVNQLSFDADDTLPGSGGLPTLIGTSTNNSYITGFVPAPANGSRSWRVEFCFKIDELPATGPWSFIRVTTADSTLVEWKVQMNDAGGEIVGVDSDGVEQINEAFVWSGSFIPEGDWFRLFIQVTDGSPDFTWEVGWIEVGVEGQSISDTFTGDSGYVTSIGGPGDGFHPDISGLAVGHFAVFSDVDSTIFNFADHGFDEETARDRLERLGEEEGVTVNVYGEADEEMGPQRPLDFLALLQECADADMGLLGEERGSVALQYLSRTVLYDQQPAAVLDYDGSDGLVTPIEPVDDDRFIRNEIQVSRDDGTNQVAELATGGPLAVDQVGRYFDSWTLNLPSDERALHSAYWRLHLGTWDESRWTQITVKLQNAVDRIDDVAALDLGAVLSISDPPSWVPPNQVNTMIQGYEELLHQYQWEITYNTSPADAWRTVHVAADDDADDAEAVRADTGGCELNEALTTTETAADVHNTAAYRWIDSATYSGDFPFDVNIGGERCTVTALTSYFQDTFTRSETDTWGTPTIGPGAYTNTGGVAGNYDVTGSVGTHTLTTVNASRRSTVTQPHADFDIQVDVASNDAPGGGSQFVGPMARHLNGDNMYHARLEWTTAGACVIGVQKRVGGSESTVASMTTGHTFAINTFFRIRFRGDGTRLRVRVWLTTETEPTHWHIDTTDSDLTAAGTIGVRSILSASNTDTNPVMSYDNLIMYSDQIMTLTRSVNGVVKEQTSGTDVRLWTPPIIAH